METRLSTQRTLVEQFFLFLKLKRRTWTGLQILLDESHLTRPQFFLLRALEGETVRCQALTIQQMQECLFNPYATRFPIFDQLPLLVKQSYLQQQDERYVVTEAGRLLINRIERAARTYIGSLAINPPTDLTALAAALVEQVHRAWQSPEPLTKAHQARTQRRLPIEEAPALVQIEWAVLGLWEARDDAHIAAWRAHQFTGPIFDILSRIWSKEAQTIPSLLSTLETFQQPTDIYQGIHNLIKSGYILGTNDSFELTQQGQKIRDAIERETDRIFFSSWEQLTDEKVMWLGAQLSEVCSYFKSLN